MTTKQDVHKGSLFRTCKGCNQTFEIPKVFYTAPNGRVTHRWDQRVYCSIDCYKAHRVLKDRFTVCSNLQCLIKFKQDVKIYKGKKTPKKNKYCSISCYQIHRSRMSYLLICKMCGKNFNISNRQISTKLCSDECRLKAKQETKYRARDKLYKAKPGTYKLLLKIQDGRCAICRKHPSSKRLLAFDHCHETNQVRGLLCSRCNLGLGLFNDNWLLLNNAEEYLAYWHSKHGSSKVQTIQESPTLN